MDQYKYKLHCHHCNKVISISQIPYTKMEMCNNCLFLLEFNKLNYQVSPFDINKKSFSPKFKNKL